MPTFPTLRTGAIAQYPATVKTSFGNTKVVEFLDGSSQRYSAGAAPLRQWIVRLERLDAREDALVTAFVKNNVEGTFVFNDPFSGISATKCALRGPEMQNVIAGELNQESAFVIEELP
jgi:hypothetical protein